MARTVSEKVGSWHFQICIMTLRGRTSVNELVLRVGAAPYRIRYDLLSRNLIPVVPIGPTFTFPT